MKVIEAIRINRPIQAVWTAVTDIDQCEAMLTNVIAIKVLNRPTGGLVGLKWQETREMFGKPATETMWITEAVAQEYYLTRAESHGSVYLTEVSTEENGSGTLLTMRFSAQPQTAIAKMLALLMALFIKGSVSKALAQDLQDIKEFVEG